MHLNNIKKRKERKVTMSLTLNEANVIANGNEQAALFLVDYVAFCHHTDDLIDDRQQCSDESIIKIQLNLLRHFCFTGWVQQNSASLFPLIVSGFNAWLDSNVMANSTDKRTQLSSDVVKGIYHEIVYAVAFLCGGYEHMRLVSQTRNYDYDVVMQLEKQ